MSEYIPSPFVSAASLGFIQTSPETLDRLFQTERPLAAMKVYTVLAFNCNLKTGAVHPYTIDKIAELGAMCLSSAYRGYQSLVDAELFVPDEDSMVVKGKLVLDNQSDPPTTPVSALPTIAERRKARQARCK